MPLNLVFVRQQWAAYKLMDRLDLYRSIKEVHAVRQIQGNKPVINP